MIELINVSKQYANGTVALKLMNLKIEKGDFAFLIGASGAGKSSIIKILMKEEDVTDGQVIVNDTDITELKRGKIPYYRRKLGVVFQDFRLLPDKTIFDNVAYALEIMEAPRREIRKKVNIALGLVGLGRKYKCRPGELSGGEQQRVAIARAIVNKPLILIADEPTGNLDPETSLDIMDLLNQIHQMGTTVIVSTHEKYLVDKMKMRVVEIANGEIIRDQQKGQYENEN